MAEETGKDAPQDAPPAETHQLPPETITAGGKEWASIDELVKGYEHAQLKISEQGGELGKLRKDTQDDDIPAPLDDAKPPTHTPFVELMFDDAEGAEAALAERIAEKVLAETDARAEQRDTTRDFFRRHPNLKGQEALIGQVFAEMREDIAHKTIEAGLDDVAQEVKGRILEGAKNLGFAIEGAEVIEPSDVTAERGSGGGPPAAAPVSHDPSSGRKPKDMVTRMAERTERKRLAARAGVLPRTKES